MNQKIKNFFSFRTVLVLGILACLVCIIPFSRNLIISLMENFVLHRQLRDIQKWTDILVHSMFYFITIMSFWLFFWYSKKGKEIGHSIFEILILIIPISLSFRSNFTSYSYFISFFIFCSCNIRLLFCFRCYC